MRYLICSDIHLNLGRRFDDTVSALNQVAQAVHSAYIDKVLVLGDTFTSRRPHSKELATFESWAMEVTKERLDNGGTPWHTEVVVLRGNHDEYPDGTHSYHAFEKLKVPHVKVVTNPHVEDNIFMGHFLLREAKIGPTDFRVLQSMSVEELLDKYPPMSMQIAAYVLGDVHKHQVISEHPLILYAGSIEHVDFGERDDPKGFIFLTVENGKAHWDFVPLNTRPMIQYDINLSTYNRPDSSAAEVEGAIIKLIFHGTPSLIKEVDEQGYRSLFHHAKEVTIQYDVEKGTVVRDSEVNESATPIDALRKYVVNLTISEQEKAEVIRLGQEIINASP